jgi:hypothetical protein
VVFAAIDGLRPVSASDFKVIGAISVEVDLTVTVHGLSIANKDALHRNITAFINGLAIGSTLYFVQVGSLCVESGAQSADSFSDIVPQAGPDTYEVLRSGDIEVVLGA